MIVTIMDNSMLVAIGNTRTRLSFFKIKSPGSLKSGIRGKSKKTTPSIMNTTPRMIRNLAILGMGLDNGFSLVTHQERSPVVWASHRVF